MASSRKKVIIIGAGAAGLQCARSLLSEHGLAAGDVLVLEARNSVGGRMQQSGDFAPGHLVELGAEFVYGTETRTNPILGSEPPMESPASGLELEEVFTWAQGRGGPSSKACARDGGVGMYYVGLDRRLLQFDARDEDFVRLNAALKAIGDTSGAALKAMGDTSDGRLGDLSVGQYLLASGVPLRMLPVAEAGYANNLGAGLHRLSLATMASLQRHRVETDNGGGGVSDFRPRGSFSRLVQLLVNPVDAAAREAREVTAQEETAAGSLTKNKAAGAAPLEIKTSSPVRQVLWGGGRDKECHDKDCGPIRLECGPTLPQVLEADVVVVTVPLPILRDGRELCFQPPLPAAHLESARALEVAPAAKLLMLFKGRDGVIPDRLHGLVSSDCAVPELWFRDLEAVGDADHGSAQGQGGLLATGFFTGTARDEAVALGQDALASAALDQLEEIFPSGGRVHAQFVRAELHDWGPSTPFIRCGVSSPGLTGAGDFAAHQGALAAPLAGGRLLFAGEAYVSQGGLQGGTVHGALEQGHRAAREAADFLRSLGGRPGGGPKSAEAASAVLQPPKMLARL
mmetsp:Transcript_61993/g.140257  ORF Transcript_61993/g.140257 Transcript_61993/m.140257 type:complete len:571 (-) Transcript_61993:180-1892(-)